MARASDKHIVVGLASAIQTFLANHALAVKHNAKEERRYQREIKAAKVDSRRFAGMARDADDDESAAIFHERAGELRYIHDQLEQKLVLYHGMFHLDDLWKGLYSSYKTLRGQYVLEVGDNGDKSLVKIIEAFDEISHKINHNGTCLWDCPRDTERAFRKLRHITRLIETQKTPKSKNAELARQEPVSLRRFMEKYCVNCTPGFIASRVKALQNHKDIDLPKAVGTWTRGKTKLYHPDDLKKNWKSYREVIPNLPALIDISQPTS